jgi:hypothetical protein
MGGVMVILESPILVSFHRKGDELIAAVPLDYIREGIVTKEDDLIKIVKIYEKKINELSKILNQIEVTKSKKIPLTALEMWVLGDKIMSLIEEIKKRNFEIDGLYDHLIRDLGRKKDWLKKVIIFRRHLPNKNLIPENLSWSTCKDIPRISAEQIMAGDTPRPKK